MMNSIFMLTLNSLQYVFHIFVLILLNVSMMAGSFPKTVDVTVRDNVCIFRIVVWYYTI